MHECEPFGVGDEVARELHRSHQRAVRGFFVVEMKRIVGVPDGVDALAEGDPFVAGASLLVAGASLLVAGASLVVATG